jgi:hypothetical protein
MSDKSMCVSEEEEQAMVKKQKVVQRVCVRMKKRQEPFIAPLR